MLDFVYYPISGILWFWHKIFGFSFTVGSTEIGLGPDSGIAWALSVVFLVFTARLLIYKPFVKQVRTTRKMQELQPQLQALKKKYGKDRQRMALEMQKLNKDHGFNPLMGCLPMFVQIPVFLGLYHVLRSFNRTGDGFGQLGMSPAQNANTPNYWFPVSDVQSFLSARLFGAPISAAVNTPAEQLEAFRGFGGIPTVWTAFASEGATLTIIPTVFFVGLPLMLMASVATHFNMRASISRQTAAVADQPQTKIMNQLGLWVFPLGVIVFGWLLPIAVLLYWVANNVWTYGQQHLVFNQLDAEEEAARLAAKDRQNEKAPKVGAKPLTQKQIAAQRAEDAAAKSLVSDSVGSIAQELIDEGAASPSTAKQSSSAKPANRKKPASRPARPNRGSGNQRRKRR